MNNIGWKGHYRIEKRRNGQVVQVVEKDNTICLGLTRWLIYMLTGVNWYRGDENPFRLTWLGVGTGTTPAQITDMGLEHRIWRGQYTQQTTPTQYAGSTQLVTTWVVPYGEAVAHITEIGAYIGVESDDSNLTLLSRINVDIEKTASEELIITRTDGIVLNV